ncbi:MAG TPA: lysophospholipid acyltransferase family protein, partial [Anseongella sp.]|nr:lysophospholipid acyltransferase family protein [Anseongella sp.]
MKRLSYYLSLPFLYGIALLPYPLFYLLSDLFCLVLYRVIGYRKKVVMENLRNAFPEKTPEERRNIAAQFYRNLADIMLETIRMLTISRKSLLKRFPLLNAELAEKYQAQGRSIVAAVGHFGNWEWACLVPGIRSSRPSIVIYKPLSNPWFDRLFRRMRSRTGVQMVPMKQTLRKLVEYRKQPTLTVFASDQTPV